MQDFHIPTSHIFVQKNMYCILVGGIICAPTIITSLITSMLANLSQQNFQESFKQQKLLWTLKKNVLALKIRLPIAFYQKLSQNSKKKLRLLAIIRHIVHKFYTLMSSGYKTHRHARFSVRSQNNFWLHFHIFTEQPQNYSHNFSTKP